ncbi:MAG: hypothetical protein AAF570_05580 [Bacteroidota bacterium]
MSAGLFMTCNTATETTEQDQNSNQDLVGLARTSYNRGGVSFSLANIDGFKMSHPDSVPWANYMPDTDGNGQIHYFFRIGHKVELSSPQVRVEYIAKDMPSCGSLDELQGWLKQSFVNDERKCQVISTGGTVKTMDGQDIEIFEIHCPQYHVNDSLTRSEKTMAWAYVDHDTRYVGFSYSAVNPSDYDEALPLFKDLVRSYKDE